MMSAGSRNTWIPTLEEGIQQVNNISHNWNPIMPGNEDAIISWIPVTPRTDMQGNQMENENWQDLIGIYKDLLQGETLDLNLLQDPNPTLPPPMLQSSQNPDCIANSIPFPDHSFNQASRSELDAVCSSTIDSFKSPEFCINNKRVPETFNFSEGYENQLHVIGDSSSVIEGNKQFVDDLKTPEKKTPSKRKKHRPKVVTESNRQPKDPKKNTTLKRKYVKKKGNEVSKPGVDQNGVNGKRKYVRKNEQNISCKRRLNFDFDFDLNAHPQDIISNSIPIKDNQRNGNNQWDQYVYEGAIQTGYASCINLQKASQSLNSDERNLWNANDMDSIVMYQNLLLGFEPRNNNINDFASIFMEKSQKTTIISASTTSTWDSPLKKLTAKPNSTNTAKGRGKKRKIGGLIDDIVCKFEGLRICEERENGDGAIVLYRDERGLVPFEVVKKRKARPKVDLDSETERVWRVLMGKEGSEGTETCDGDKEKWWEDERRVFRGRVDSFIARMHLVQGDRRFSQWKGSVVDSVIGVFLTQNVTDHLSSSAFMSLAAKFPLNSTTTKQTTCRDTPCEPIEIASKETIDGIISSSGSNSEPEISIIDKAETSSNDQNHDSMMGTNVLKVDEKNKEFDWDSLRKEAMSNGEKRERGKDRGDSIDYETMRRAHVNKISDAIKERGMNNMLADRIHDFLNRLVRDHGSIDLEWLRDIPTDKAKDYLLSIRGLGLKSVECVRLLSLHHLAFPVDTNVGRIAVRLGWVPLQPLPESLQLHLLEMYPVLESIQKYLWPRLCKLDQLTLYELHYQMITFGKVFCTKSKPNCNACPMRGECRHFASAFASARLALPGPQEKRIVPQTPHTALPIFHMPMALPPNEGYFGKECAPIIEEPKTPEPEDVELSIKDIEDQYYDDDDSDEIPTIKLNMEEFTTNLQNVMQDSIELQEDMSKALVALKPEAASIPTPKLKNVSRLRTEHQVYELPDSHPLLEGFDKRESDDPSPYLLSIWTPGETANSTQIPEKGCPDQESCKLCDRETCFSCNTIKEANLQVVRGTILIPCRTATRGSFPLNGTYFQVNEVFADHESSLNPIDVPRAWIWNLPRRTVYFGTSVSTIFKGLTTEGIQYCFWRGFVCVRGFDQKTRAPRPLMARLHFPASKMVKRRHIDEELNKDKLAD